MMTEIEQFAEDFTTLWVVSGMKESAKKELLQYLEQSISYARMDSDIINQEARISDQEKAYKKGYQDGYVEGLQDS